MNSHSASHYSPARIIRSREGNTHIADLLQSVFAAELLRPSERIFLVSPWISDIHVLDNTAGQFATVVPEWDHAFIRLSKVLGFLAEQQTQLHIATNHADHNEHFRRQMADFQKRADLHIEIHIANKLHEKGLLGDGYYLAGSFNFTYGGISLNEEVAQFHTDTSVIAEHRVHFNNRWVKGMP